MTGTYNAGTPLYTDGGTYAMAAWRQFDAATAVIDAGTTTAVAPAGGVFPSGSGAPLKVSAGGGMTVAVNAGYCSVPSSSASGTYLTGLLQSAVLTVAANSTGSTRKDYVLANVQDLGNSGSFAQVQYVTGTTSPPAVPANSIILAEVDVTNGASSVTAGMITDKRAYVVAPGGVLPVSSLAAAPVSTPSQMFYDLAANRLSMPLTWGEYQAAPALSFQGGAAYGFVTFTADGVSDYKISTGYASIASVTTAAAASIVINIDGVNVDQIIFRTDTQGRGLVNYTYYTTGAQGTTLPAGQHTVVAELISPDSNAITANLPGFLRVARAPL